MTDNQDKLLRKPTLFESVIKVCNAHVGETIKRDDLYNQVRKGHEYWLHTVRHTVRNYLQLLQAAGYVDIMNLTYCKVLKDIPNQKILDFQFEARERRNFNDNHQYK
jgi:Fe2+ or Zn2+ uptake regulation protein